MKRMVLAAVALSFALTACGTTTQSVATQPGGDDGDPSSQSSGGEEVAGIGDTITLHGSDDALQVDITVKKMVDPAKASNQFLAPRKGNRYVAVQVEIANTGEAAYDDSPSNGSVLIDTDSQQFQADLFDSVEPALGSPTIKSGDSRVGYITFELPKKSEPATFQFTLDSGFGPETGEWTLS